MKQQENVKHFRDKSYDIPFITRTITSNVTFHENGQEQLEKLGAILGKLRNQDYKKLLQAEQQGEKLTTKQRRDALQTEGLNISYADAIISENNEQRNLVERSRKQNLHDWEKELHMIEKQLSHQSGKQKDILIKRKEKIEKNIRNTMSRGNSVCFGSKRAMQQYTQAKQSGMLTDEIEKNYHNNRMFLFFQGRSRYAAGSLTLRISPSEHPDTWEITILLPKDLEHQFDTKTLNIGTMSIKNEQQEKDVLYCLKNRVCLSYRFVWSASKQRWLVHLIYRVNQYHLENQQEKHVDAFRVCGIDQNAGFITATIIDEHGNPLVKKTFPHTSAKEMQVVVHEILSWCKTNKCYRVAHEDLRSLNQAKQKVRSNHPRVNKVVNKIPHGALKKQLHNQAAQQGYIVLEVNPAYTSQATKEWKEPWFGETIHEKASYLIARRGAGLSIHRRNNDLEQKEN